MTDPALDRLWETQAGLSQLARTLPPDAWAHFGKSIVTLTRPLVQDDWQRFDSYAARIRNFGFEPDGTFSSNAWHPVNYAVLDAFSAHHAGAPLLPRLRRLRLTTAHTKSMQLLELVLTSSLMSVTFDFGLHWRLQEEQMFVTAVLAGVEERCPYLEEIIVDRIPFERVATSLRALAYMLPQYLYTPNLSVGDIARLAAIPRLRHAEFRIRDVADVPPPFHTLQTDAFGSLRTLGLHVHSLEICTALLKLLRTPYLEAFGVHAEERPEPSTLSTFLAQLLSVAPLLSSARSESSTAQRRPPSSTPGTCLHGGAIDRLLTGASSLRYCPSRTCASWRSTSPCGTNWTTTPSYEWQRPGRPSST
ncbi:hypothetical protein EVJ58_g74 [Rhodofomes roseus]|uniref:Uncharacterized protein n=1 Tax=Rhodofomes roseus TaxID=34475 RepID=A0A4Y9Z831_9APHY|nr:hypothetical protein EVJ58_g74 [Rhodofomes roseus]